MADVTLKQCDECLETIAPGHRRYVVSVSLAGVNGETREAHAGLLDLCSAACIQRTVERMIGEVR